MFVRRSFHRYVEAFSEYLSLRLSDPLPRLRASGNQSFCVIDAGPSLARPVRFALVQVVRHIFECIERSICCRISRTQLAQVSLSLPRTLQSWFNIAALFEKEGKLETWSLPNNWRLIVSSRASIVTGICRQNVLTASGRDHPLALCDEKRQKRVSCSFCDRQPHGASPLTRTRTAPSSTAARQVQVPFGCTHAG